MPDRMNLVPCTWGSKDSNLWLRPLRESFQQIVTLRVIQMISGHSSLETLQRYLEVTDEQIVEAVKAIGSKTSRQVEERA